MPWYWPVAVVLIGIGLMVKRVERLRLLGVAWLAGTGSFTFLMAGAYVYEALHHL